MARRTAARAVSRNAAGSLCVALALACACEKTPDLALEHLRRGDTALAEGRYAQAMAAYGHAHELAPSDPRVQAGQMRARVHVMADTPGRVGAEALEDVAYEAELLLDSDGGLRAVCLAALGNVLARRGDFDGARAKLAEAVKADPSSPIAHAALGALLMSRRETRAEAKAELELALKQRPDAPGALAALGQLQLAEGDLAGAADRLEASLRRSDDFAARMALGSARRQQGKLAEAADQFRRAAALDPRSAEALSSLGQALLGAEQLEEAERALRAAAQIQRSEATLIALGFTLARRKQSEEALNAFGQVLAENGSAASALYGSGVASEDLGRTEAALGYYRRVIALPAEGAQRPLIDELRKEAQGRIDALTAAPAGSASVSAAPGAPRAPGGPAPSGGGPGR